MENLGHDDVVCGDVDDNNGSSDIGMVMVDGWWHSIRMCFVIHMKRITWNVYFVIAILVSLRAIYMYLYTHTVWVCVCVCVHEPNVMWKVIQIRDAYNISSPQWIVNWAWVNKCRICICTHEEIVCLCASVGMCVWKCACMIRTSSNKYNCAAVAPTTVATKLLVHFNIRNSISYYFSLFVDFWNWIFATHVEVCGCARARRCVCVRT